MKKGQLLTITTKAGDQLYFIGYSHMQYNGRPLLICATDVKNKNTYGQYTEERS